jgi:hypothetical protein
MNRYKYYKEGNVFQELGNGLLKLLFFFSKLCLFLHKLSILN